MANFLITYMYIWLRLAFMILSAEHRTKDGRLIKIKDMTDDHLVNAIKYGEEHFKYLYWRIQVPRFAKELDRRRK
jgi:hypothetical protein